MDEECDDALLDETGDLSTNNILIIKSHSVAVLNIAMLYDLDMRLSFPN